LISFCIGYFVGTFVTMKAVTDIASRFIDIDYDLVSQALGQYNNNIKSGYPIS